jgi:hypothetical protein
MTSIQRWERLGLVFSAKGQAEWLHSHAAVPIAENIDGDFFRIYFSSRDRSNRSFTGSVVVDINNPTVVLDLSLDPILTPGRLGEFDDSGSMATWLVKYRGRRYMYYIGWNLGVTVPFRNSIGLAVSEGAGNFVRYADGPLIDRTLTEPHFCASCCVVPGDEIWRMWYLSCTEWRIGAHGPEHKYHIKYAESADGIVWNRDGVIAIDYADASEYAISRPSVIHENGIWKMWFSSRGPAYRIGYAESEDGKQWNRLDSHVGISAAGKGWDSEMIEYPFVFDHKGSRYMLYNGNDYGRTGFGIAMQQAT